MALFMESSLCCLVLSLIASRITLLAATLCEAVHKERGKNLVAAHGDHMPPAAIRSAAK